MSEAFQSPKKAEMNAELLERRLGITLSNRGLGQLAAADTQLRGKVSGL